MSKAAGERKSHDQAEGSAATKQRGTAKLSWWHAGGLHAHVTYPDGSTLHRIWPKDSYWEIDALRYELEREYAHLDVTP